LPMRILDSYATRLDAQDPVRGVAELKDVSGQALDRKVLVDRADQLAGGLEHDVVVGRVGNRASGGDRGEARAAASAQDAVHGVTVRVGCAMPAAGGGGL